VPAAAPGREPGGFALPALVRASEGGGPEAIIQFTGHGHKGEIASLANFNHPDVNVSGLGHRNVTTIVFMPR